MTRYRMSIAPDDLLHKAVAAAEQHQLGGTPDNPRDRRRLLMAHGLSIGGGTAPPDVPLTDVMAGLGDPWTAAVGALVTVLPDGTDITVESVDLVPATGVDPATVLAEAAMHTHVSLMAAPQWNDDTLGQAADRLRAAVGRAYASVEVVFDTDVDYGDLGMAARELELPMPMPT